MNASPSAGLPPENLSNRKQGAVDVLRSDAIVSDHATVVRDDQLDLESLLEQPVYDFRRRYATGELTEEQYEDMRVTLERGAERSVSLPPQGHL